MTGDGATPARRPRRAINGVVLVDKPSGITSNATLQRVKRAYGAEKAGHTGTLDPLATGLLPVCFGEATKFSAALLDADKAYRSTVELGVVTDTGDREGTVIARRNPQVTRAQAEQALDGFRGEILQRPHRYSAIKREGKALYRYAREGIDVDIEPRRVTIHRIELARWAPPCFDIDVLCSKGTYIRSLAEDIGEALGCGAHVAMLHRTHVGHLDVSRAHALEWLESTDEAGRAMALNPMSLLVEQLPAIELDPGSAQRFLDGQRIACAPRTDVATARSIAVRRRGQTGDDGFLGLGMLSGEGSATMLAPVRVISSAKSGASAAHTVSETPRSTISRDDKP